MRGARRAAHIVSPMKRNGIASQSGAGGCRRILSARLRRRRRNMPKLRKKAKKFLEREKLEQRRDELFQKIGEYRSQIDWHEELIKTYQKRIDDLYLRIGCISILVRGR
jgi:uncharacterized coiled-coil DUF342 family protein